MAPKRIDKRIKVALICLAIVILAGALFLYCKSTRHALDKAPAALQKNEEVDNENENSIEDIPNDSSSIDDSLVEPIAIPDKFQREVPFMTQAPLYNWDSLHEDACEEASILMLYHYLNNTKIDTRSQFEEEIQNLVAYENANGYGPSITLKDLTRLAYDYFNIESLQISAVAGADDIKKVIYQSGPVIVGAAGKKLNNPNFRNGGPNYHMLVIKGYDENGFITNDPGTRNGENYYYDQDVLLNAIHDWNPTDITLGAKNVLFALTPQE